MLTTFYISKPVNNNPVAYMPPDAGGLRNDLFLDIVSILIGIILCCWKGPDRYKKFLTLGVQKNTKAKYSWSYVLRLFKTFSFYRIKNSPTVYIFGRHKTKDFNQNFWEPEFLKLIYVFLIGSSKDLLRNF